MIKNERQYKITSALARQFEEALVEMRQRTPQKGVDPLAQQLEVEALKSQLADFRSDLEAYQALRSGKQNVSEVKSLADLPLSLIRARIASGMSQRELADKLGLKEQQIQRYEATEYASANMNRVLEVAGVLGLKLSRDLAVREQPSLKTLLRRLSDVGIDPELIINRLMPRGSVGDAEASGNYLSKLLTNIQRTFGWSISEILGNAPLSLNTALAGGPRFKVPANVDERRLGAYTIYAHCLASLAVEVTRGLSPKEIPTEPDRVRKAIVTGYGSVSFESVLQYVWGLGIAVLPLRDSGVFHAACWRIDGRNVIVLRQKTRSSARWAFDLLHDLWHIAQEPGEREMNVIDWSEVGSTNAEEEAASQFAGNVLLAGKAEELAELCVESAKNRVEWLKAVVPEVAARHRVDMGSLASYMAFRLSLQDINWWGAANNLQGNGVDPWQVARDAFLTRVDWTSLSESDRDLLIQALAEE